MYNNLSNQSKELLDTRMKLRQSLSQILPKDLVDYIMELIVKDLSHQKFIELSKD